MKKMAIIFFVLFLGIPLIAIPISLAQDAELNTLDLLIVEARKNNPTIQAAHKVYLASEELFAQAVSLPDPRLNAGYFFENVETRVGPQVGKYGVSQKFPFFGKLKLKGKIALRERDITFQEYKAIEQEVIKELKHAYFDLYWIRESTAITEDIKGLLNELEKVAQSKYSTGIASQQDVMKAQVEISKLLAKLYTLSEREVTLQEKINTLLNRPIETPIGIIKIFELTAFPYNLQELIDLSDEYRQELKAASLNIDKHTNIVSLKKKDYFPDFTLGVDFFDVDAGHTSATDDGQDAWMGKLSINLPIWLGRIKAGVNEAKYKLGASENVYDDVKNRVSFQLKDAFFKLKTAEDLVNLYKDALIPQAEVSLKASQAGYETGKTDFLNLIDSERVLLNFEIAYYRAVADYEKSIADLERAVGIGFEEFGK